MTRIPARLLDRATWHVPPECQGQTVEYAYASCPEVACEYEVMLRRITDRSDGSIAYQASAEAWLAGERWEPWNGEPGADDWQTVELR